VKCGQQAKFAVYAPVRTTPMWYICSRHIDRFRPGGSFAKLLSDIQELAEGETMGCDLHVQEMDEEKP
jgi:hypothetical protein